MILDALIQKIKEELPESTWHLVPGDVPTIVFPATSSDFGDIHVMEQGDEITVLFGHFTHCHFGCYEPALSEAARVDAIASDAASCLADVFAGRLEFYGSHTGAGGFRKRGTQGVLSRFIFGRSAHVWSVRDD